ncbi:MAG TPA: hypothetical protein VGD74_12295 [Vulgatibacter sp.]
MMHDLFLHPAPGGTDRTFDEIHELLRRADTLAPYVNEEGSTAEQIVLTDPDTGVWALLTPGGPWLDEEHEPDPRVLHLQIPYARPRFFAIEGALFAMALVQELGGTLADPADPARPEPRDRREEEIVATWDAQNAEILAGMSEPAPGSGALPVVTSEGPKRVDGTLLGTVFSHNLHRRELLERAEGKAEIPRLVLASLPMRAEPAVVCGYTAGEGLWLPDVVSHVALRRLRKGWLGSKEESVLVEADALRRLLEGSEVRDEAPAGLRAYHPSQTATDPFWKQLEGPPARGVAVLDWNGMVDA